MKMLLVVFGLFVYPLSGFAALGTLVKVTGNYQVKTNENVIIVTVLTGGTTITLPLSTEVSGPVIIKKQGGNASLTVAGINVELIEGSATDVITQTGKARLYLPDNGGWFVINLN